jgi:hypothetical protein
VSEIRGVPASIREVPHEGGAWREWAERALAYRTQVHDRARDPKVRDEIIARCAADPCYEFLVVGCIFEPRPRANPDGSIRPAGWYPWLPYGFQVDTIRWVEDAMNATPGSADARLGRGDGVLEKARGMAGSWTFCGFVGNRWRHEDGFVAGMMSYKEDLVDKRYSTDSLFYKIKGYLGLDEKVPLFREMAVGGGTLRVPIRPPEWTVPEGFSPREHTQDLIIAHPERTNLIAGYSTGEKTGTGGRATMFVLDEAAKFTAFMTVWNSLNAVTDHRFALSSADTRQGTGFRDLARNADQACQKGTAGPSFLRLRPEAHPERDEVWREEIEARQSGIASAEESVMREYDLDYEAGHGAHIYPSSHLIEPRMLTFDPAVQSLDFCIDPGIRDLTAFHLVSYDPTVHRYGVLASYTNHSKPSDFYASLVMATPLGHHDYTDEDFRIMDWFANHGRSIRFWVGDPAGKARGGGQATSFYEDFFRATLAISDQRKGIMIWNSDKVEFRSLQKRHDALRWMLSIMDFNDTPDVVRTLNAVRDHRYRATNEERETTNPMAETVRHPGHDRVTALEFLAGHRRAGSTAAAMGVAPARRVTIGGTPWSNRKKAVAGTWKGYGS